MSNKLSQSQIQKLIRKAQYAPKVYRAFDVEAKKMYSPEELFKMGVFVTPTGLLWSATGKELPIRVMSFTGLKDNKGKPLFEGDICRITVNVDIGMGFPMNIEKWAVMRWVNASFTFQMPDILGSNGQFAVSESYLEGNEWENPDLLTKLE